MGKKTAKSTKKFVQSGQLKKTIENRKKQKQVRKKMESRRGASSKAKPKAKGKESAMATSEDGEHDEDQDEDQNMSESGPSTSKKTSKMTVDDFLGGNFMDASDEGSGLGSDAEEDGSDDSEDMDDASDFGSVDGLDGDGKGHLLELSKLAEKDPEFFKYLQENDKELLDFNPDGLEDEDEDMADGETAANQLPILTRDIIQKWQKAILEQRSLRALRKLLIAYRSAAHMNEDDKVLAWRIDSSSVYNKLITTALKYTPVVLEHHVPYKTMANGKFKAPTQTTKLRALQKLILSFFNNTTHLLTQLTDDDTVSMAVSESAKIIPYVTSSRKTIKLYLKKLLELWSSASDSVRIASFLAIRKLASSTDESISDNVLKSTYLTLLRTSKNVNAYSMPSITLMKNSASELFSLEHTNSAVYQHAFGYIRQLAIHLRNSMKVKTKDAFKQVYNWQFVHSIDFWCIVIGRACKDKPDSELRPLIYPLVQVSLGAIKLVPNSRSHPLHLQLLRSLLHLSSHTRTYIPLTPYILPILHHSLSPTSSSKKSTLKPLDLDLVIRAPQQYLKTQVYSSGLVEEASFVLTEWLVSAPVCGSVAFPEMVIPITVALRKIIKGSKSRDVAGVKVLVERIEDNAKWISQKRSRGLSLNPSNIDAVAQWEEKELKNKIESESPLGKYTRVTRRAREKRRQLVDKARKGEDEILDESDDD